MQLEETLRDGMRDTIESRIQFCSEEFFDVRKDLDESILTRFSDPDQLHEVDANILRMRARYKIRLMQQYAHEASENYVAHGALFADSPENRSPERVIQRLGIERILESHGPIILEAQQILAEIEQKIIDNGWAVADVDLYSLSMALMTGASDAACELEFFLQGHELSISTPTLDNRLAILGPVLVTAQMNLYRVQQLGGD